MGRARGWLEPDVDDHNGPQFLVVKFCEMLKQPKWHLGRHKLLHPGWYVVRTCPCHWGERVTAIAHPTRESAEHSRQVMLAVPKELSDGV